MGPPRGGVQTSVRSSRPQDVGRPYELSAPSLPRLAVGPLRGAMQTSVRTSRPQNVDRPCETITPSLPMGNPSGLPSSSGPLPRPPQDCDPLSNAGECLHLTLYHPLLRLQATEIGELVECLTITRADFRSFTSAEYQLNCLFAKVGMRNQRKPLSWVLTRCW